MNKMDYSVQRKMLRVIDKATNDIAAGEDIASAIAKQAAEAQLTIPQTERVCEAYNKASAVAHMKTADEETRCGEYPLAKVAEVVSLMVKGKKDSPEETFSKEASEFFGNIKRRDDVADTPVLTKTAADETPVPKTKQDIAETLEELAVVMDKFAVQLDLDKARINSKRAQAFKAVLREVDSISHDKNSLEKKASLLSNGYGIPVAEAIVSKINSARGYQTLPVMDKTAHACIFPDEPFFNKIAEFLEAEEEYAHSKERQIIQKEADGVLDVADNYSNQVADSMTIGHRGAPSVNISTGFGGTEDVLYRDLNSRKLLYEMLLDDDLKTYSPLKVKEHYNELVKSFPELMSSKNNVRSILRKTMAQGGALDVYEIKDLLEANSAINKATKDRAAARGALQDASKPSSSGAAPIGKRK
jgi:hypothetical protein